MLANKTTRYAMFGMLYFVQGAILSYFTALNALYLLSFNLSMGQIGLMGAVAMIPFVIKIFLGMLSDRVNLGGWGHRKPYIVIGLLVQSVCLFIVPFIHPGKHFWLFAMAAFTLMLGMALYDTATDGLALDTTPFEEQGTIQGFMVGGRALGVVVISAVIGSLVQATSWQTTFWMLGIVTLIPLILVFQVKEAQRPASREFEWKAFGAMLKPQIITLALLGALYSLVINGANQLVNPFLQVKFSIGYATAGFVTTIWGIGVVIGSLTGGRLIDRLGHLRSVIVAIVLTILAVSAMVGIFSLPIAWVVVAVFGVAFGYYETVYFALSMEVTDPRIAASMFSILMAIANVGTGIGLAASGAFVEAVGYQWAFVFLAVINLLAIPLLPVIFRKNARGQEVPAQTV